MTTTTRIGLMEALAAMGYLYPGMRFGQLFEFAALLASECDGPDLVANAQDEAILEASRQHLIARARPIQELQAGDRPALEPARIELIKCLTEMGLRRPDLPVGRLIVQLASEARVSTYDIEDEPLLDAVRCRLASESVEGSVG